MVRSYVRLRVVLVICGEVTPRHCYYTIEIPQVIGQQQMIGTESLYRL